VAAIEPIGAGYRPGGRRFGTGEAMSATTVPGARLSFNDPELNREIMRLRAVDHATNLGFLAIEYAGLAAVIGAAIAFREWRRGSGLSWGWDIPVLALGIVLVGALQHRLAGLGHEAAHYSFLKNKLLNDLIGDVFCLFPILSNIHFYRLFHLAHHQYTNDPSRDPDLVTLGGSKMVERFPMSRWDSSSRSISGRSPTPWRSSDTSGTTSISTCSAGRRTSTSVAGRDRANRAGSGPDWGRCSD
jgi:Fatty acid desaturase